MKLITLTGLSSFIGNFKWPDLVLLAMPLGALASNSNRMLKHPTVPLKPCPLADAVASA